MNHRIANIANYLIIIFRLCIQVNLASNEKMLEIANCGKLILINIS